MSESSLKRSITWVQGTTLTIGAVLGCGILVLPSITASNAGPVSLLSWTLMSLLAFPIVLTIAQLAKKIPSAGGIMAYIAHAFGAKTSALLSWVMLGSIPVGLPTIALTGAYYVNDLLPTNRWGVVCIAALILLTSLLFHVKGIDLSAKVSVLAICLILFLLVMAVIVAFPYVKISSFTPFAPHGWFPVGSASVVIFFSFVGWEMITPLAEEFKRPGRDIAISLVLGAGCISVLYLLVSFVTIGTHAYGTSNGMASLSMLVAKGWGHSGIIITTVLALFITFSTVHANIAGFSRMVYAQARAGCFPAKLARLHPKFQTPVHVLAALGGAFAFILLLYGTIALDLENLLKGPSVVFITSYIFTMLAALKMLKSLTIGWFMALLSLLITVIVLFFSGWAIVYPVALAVVGAVFLHLKKTKRTND
ncbi:amino acid permease [Sporolactobacillus shoreicorticis]|uniref:APC family permease n=1 Tax=Sporolactobacillus shoreicorticis TaxID=1923877 RepID=A0ABW5S379_9BACL|nr:amino acid permease [Sporolactobacillus shoreicorticis]MCO7125889.1 amino acid permease [Sporolactobacillus shoreicorticis]